MNEINRDGRSLGREKLAQGGDMAGVSHEQKLEVIGGAPEKRLFLSIISDYDLRTGLCEPVDKTRQAPRSKPDRSIGKGRVRIAFGVKTVPRTVF